MRADWNGTAGEREVQRVAHLSAAHMVVGRGHEGRDQKLTYVVGSENGTDTARVGNAEEGLEGALSPPRDAQLKAARPVFGSKGKRR